MKTSITIIILALGIFSLCPKEKVTKSIELLEERIGSNPLYSKTYQLGYCENRGNGLEINVDFFGKSCQFSVTGSSNSKGDYLDLKVDLRCKASKRLELISKEGRIIQKYSQEFTDSLEPENGLEPQNSDRRSAAKNFLMPPSAKHVPANFADADREDLIANTLHPRGGKKVVVPRLDLSKLKDSFRNEEDSAKEKTHFYPNADPLITEDPEQVQIRYNPDDYRLSDEERAKFEAEIIGKSESDEMKAEKEAKKKEYKPSHSLAQFLKMEEKRQNRAEKKKNQNSQVDLDEFFRSFEQEEEAKRLKEEEKKARLAALDAVEKERRDRDDHEDEDGFAALATSQKPNKFSAYYPSPSNQQPTAFFPKFPKEIFSGAMDKMQPYFDKLSQYKPFKKQKIVETYDDDEYDDISDPFSDVFANPYKNPYDNLFGRGYDSPVLSYKRLVI